MRDDPGLYDYWPYRDRPKVVWPGGKRLAFWVAPNIEFYELDPPPNPQRRPWGRPLPDVLGYSYRDYGNRVGHWRLMEVLDRYRIRGSVSLSIALIEHHPEIIAECAARNWEFFSHGIYNTRYSYGMSEDQERALIDDSIRSVLAATGQRIAGWLAPALTHTERTMDLLAERGLLYTCDLFHDDQPTPVKTRTGRLVSIPYSFELNDHFAFNVQHITPRRYVEVLKSSFERLYAEGERSGTVMCIPLHAYLIGRPFRLEPFAEALEYITSHAGVWVTTGREIAEYWIREYYDSAVTAIARTRPAP